MTGFAAPNYTQTPNEFFDLHMMDMGEAELKVTLAIIRKTFGFQKTRDAISLSQLQKMTGLSRQGAFDGAEAALKRGLVTVVGKGARGVTIYGLVVDGDSSPDWSTQQTSTGLPTRLTKETNKIKKTLSPSGDGGSKPKPAKPKVERPANPLFDAVALGSFDLQKVNGDKVVGALVGKILKWLKEHDESITAERIEQFYEWYADENNGTNAPRDVSKFAVWWLKFEGDEDGDGDDPYANVFANLT